MNRIFALLVVMILLSGCLGPETGPEENVTEEGEKNITVTTTTQKNQTVERKEAEEVVIEEPEAEGIEYTLDENASIALYFIYTGNPQLHIHGEALLLKKGDFDMLIDAGPAESAGEVVNFLESRGIDDLEVLISTSADPMRYGGIQDVADSFEIEEFWWSGNSFADSTYAGIVEGISESAEIVEVTRGYARELQGIEFTVLNPKEPSFNHVDNDAIVLKVEDREFSALLTSNILIGSQSELVNNMKEEIKATVMSAPYYGVGRGTNNIGIFLLSVSPEHIVISGSSDDSAEAGGSREPFFRLMQQYGIEWTANYEVGTVRVFSDGTEYAVTTAGE